MSDDWIFVRKVLNGVWMDGHYSQVHRCWMGCLTLWLLFGFGDLRLSVQLLQHLLQLVRCNKQQHIHNSDKFFCKNLLASVSPVLYCISETGCCFQIDYDTDYDTVVSWFILLYCI